jgi:hypothetical protein
MKIYLVQVEREKDLQVFGYENGAGMIFNSCFGIE